MTLNLRDSASCSSTVPDILKCGRFSYDCIVFLKMLFSAVCVTVIPRIILGKELAIGSHYSSEYKA